MESLVWTTDMCRTITWKDPTFKISPTSHVLSWLFWRCFQNPQTVFMNYLKKNKKTVWGFQKYLQNSCKYCWTTFWVFYFSLSSRFVILHTTVSVTVHVSDRVQHCECLLERLSIFKHFSRLPPLYDGRLFTPSHVAVRYNFKNFWLLTWSYGRVLFQHDQTLTLFIVKERKSDFSVCQIHKYGKVNIANNYGKANDIKPLSFTFNTHRYMVQVYWDTCTHIAILIVCWSIYAQLLRLIWTAII